jgi:6-phospho-3-hexuloisomerase
MNDLKEYSNQINEEVTAVLSPVVCLTAQTDGKTSRAADQIVYLPAQTMADDTEGKATSVLPMGSLFELVLFVFGEIVVLELLKRSGRTFGEARDRHTNLE